MIGISKYFNLVFFKFNFFWRSINFDMKGFIINYKFFSVIRFKKVVEICLTRVFYVREGSYRRFWFIYEFWRFVIKVFVIYVTRRGWVSRFMVYFITFCKVISRIFFTVFILFFIIMLCFFGRKFVIWFTIVFIISWKFFIYRFF